MNRETILINTAIILGFVFLLLPTKVLFPYLISKQLSSKDNRLKKLLDRIPTIRIARREEAVEQLIAKKQNINFMNENYPVTFRWYTKLKKWSKLILYAFFAFVLIIQTNQFLRFVADPQGESKRMRNAAEQLFK